MSTLKNYLASLAACAFMGAFAVSALAVMLETIPTVTGTACSVLCFGAAIIFASVIED